MGYLKDTNIEIVPTASLETSIEFIKRDVVDGFCSTQRGFNVVKKLVDVTPIYLFNKSYGGDVILSNLPKEKLLALKDTTVDVYMEVESINYLMFEQFKQHYRLDSLNFNIINKTQNTIDTKKIKANSIIVSYTSFSDTFKKDGFYEIDNSKNPIYHIIDGLFIKTSTLKSNKENFKILSHSLNKSIKALKSNPKAFYEVVKKYLDNQSYEEFVESLSGIKFINGDRDEIISYLKKHNIPTNEILNESHNH
ncbi:MAG: hypothetical protein JXQ76_04655 [Campylobacterales bacterium]|nr:hypothetical protein [Campylobacterales bacterium]